MLSLYDKKKFSIYLSFKNTIRLDFCNIIMTLNLCQLTILYWCVISYGGKIWI